MRPWFCRRIRATYQAASYEIVEVLWHARYPTEGPLQRVLRHIPRDGLAHPGFECLCRLPVQCFTTGHFLSLN